jgi:hypothetical protein
LADDKVWGKALGIPETAHRLMPPVMLNDLPDELKPNDLVAIHLTNPATPKRTICKQRTVLIRQPTTSEEIVQVITLQYVYEP